MGGSIARSCVKFVCNKTRQGYARERTLKLAGYFFPGVRNVERARFKLVVLLPRMGLISRSKHGGQRHKALIVECSLPSALGLFPQGWAGRVIWQEAQR